MELSVRVQGDFVFIEDVIRGVVAQYDSGTLPMLASVLLLIGLLMWSVKYSLDSEKNAHPFKELFIGILLVGVFVLPNTSPRFDVQLIPVNSPLDAVVIDDVPFIAAVPAWAASGLIGTLTRDSQMHFGDTAGTDNTLSQPGRSPFQALLHMHNIDPSGGSFNAGLSRTMQAWLRDCYIEASTVQNITTPSAEDVKSTMPHKIWSKLAPDDNNWMVTSNYMQNPPEFYVDCREVHTTVAEYLESPSFSAALQEHFTSLGVDASQTGLLPQLLGDLDTPVTSQLMIGRFIAYQMNNALGDSQLEMAFGRGLFEAQQQRLYQRAGESEMFLQVAVPLITTLEAFVFFISPIMMLLAVLGGVGLAYVGKYLMMLLFTNVWAYIAVFVSALNSRAVVQGLETSPGSGMVDADRIFSYGNIGQTMHEIEGSLVVAATMTAGIPMIAMFLLYGGVHSLMGLMGKFGGNYDGKNAAPDLSHTTPDGKENVAGTQIFTASNGNAMGTVSGTGDNSGNNLSTSDTIQNGASRGASLVNAEMSSRGNNVLEAFSNDLNAQSGHNQNTSYGESESITAQEQMNEAQSAARKINAGENLTASEALAFSQHAGIDIGKLFGMNPVTAGMKVENTQQMQEDYRKGKNIEQADQEALEEAFSHLEKDDFVNAIAESESVMEGEGYNETANAVEAYQESENRAQQYQEVSSKAAATMAGTQLVGRDVEAATGSAVVDGINDSLTTEDVNRLNDANLGDIFIPGSGGEVGLQELNSGGGITRVVQDLMNDPDATAEEMAQNYGIAHKMLSALDENHTGGLGSGVGTTADYFKELADIGRGDLNVNEREGGMRDIDRTPQDEATSTIDAGQERVKARQAEMEEEFAAKADNFDLSKEDYSIKADEFRAKMTGRDEPGSGGTELAPMAQYWAGKTFNDDENAIQDVSRAAGYAALDSGYALNGDTVPTRSIENGMATLAGETDAITSAAHKAEHGIFNRGEQTQVQDALIAMDFLNTEDGLEMLSAMPEEQRESIINSMAALQHLDDQGHINPETYSGHASENSQTDKYKQQLYQASVDKMDDPSEIEKFNAYKASEVVTKVGAGEGMSEGRPENSLFSISSLDTDSAFESVAGLDKSYLRGFVMQNEETLNGLDLNYFDFQENVSTIAATERQANATRERVEHRESPSEEEDETSQDDNAAESNGSVDKQSLPENSGPSSSPQAGTEGSNSSASREDQGIRYQQDSGESSREPVVNPSQNATAGREQQAPRPPAGGGGVKNNANEYVYTPPYGDNSNGDADSRTEEPDDGGPRYPQV